MYNKSKIYVVLKFDAQSNVPVCMYDYLYVQGYETHLTNEMKYAIMCM